jgi:hypothetical protein
MKCRIFFVIATNAVIQRGTGLVCCPNRYLCDTTTVRSEDRFHLRQALRLTKAEAYTKMKRTRKQCTAGARIQLLLGNPQD